MNGPRSSFQAVGEALAGERWAGVLYPAAARRDAAALCVFRASGDLAGVTQPSPPDRHDEPPVPPRL